MSSLRDHEGGQSVWVRDGGILTGGAAVAPGFPGRGRCALGLRGQPRFDLPRVLLQARHRILLQERCEHPTRY